jgi:predicted amidohydrolase YtcJ
MTSLLIRDVRRVPLVRADAGDAEPVDVLVEDGAVTSIGQGLENTGGDVIEAEGRWLIPGLWDQHVHLGQWTLTSSRLDLASADSPEAAVRRTQQRAAEHPGRPVIGWGHRSATWHRAPTVSDLDLAVPDVPVVLICGDGHHAWLNSRALTALDLPHRDGVVAEFEWFAAYNRLGALTDDSASSPAAYRQTLEAAAAMGVVGMVDFEFGAPVSDWTDRWAHGADLLRVQVATYAEHLDDVIASGLRTGDALPGCDGLATMGPLKIISDGSINTRTAWCCSPYADGGDLEHPAGQPNLPASELQQLMRRAHASGLEVATHAIGDAAVDAALTAYAETLARGSIEHAQLINRADVDRMARLGLRASVQPAHLLDDRDITEQYWPDRAERCFALRWMLEGGVTLALGSDAPVSPLDPWLAMGAAVHRSADFREAWHPEQALTAREALAASTNGLGTVAVGHPGDLALLDSDPLEEVGDAAETASRLRSMRVSATVVAGRLVHGRS